MVKYPCSCLRKVYHERNNGDFVNINNLLRVEGSLVVLVVNLESNDEIPM